MHRAHEQEVERHLSTAQKALTAAAAEPTAITRVGPPDTWGPLIKALIAEVEQLKDRLGDTGLVSTIRRRLPGGEQAREVLQERMYNLNRAASELARARHARQEVLSPQRVTETKRTLNQLEPVVAERRAEFGAAKSAMKSLTVAPSTELDRGSRGLDI